MVNETSQIVKEMIQRYIGSRAIFETPVYQIPKMSVSYIMTFVRKNYSEAGKRISL